MTTPYNVNLKEISKKMRKTPTAAERCLWRKLRLKHLGYVFHRQKPVGGYIVDFYCPKVKLVIEVDGDYHSNSEVARNDKIRDEIMGNLGISILRFHNLHVMNNTNEVVKKIKQTLDDLQTNNRKFTGHDVKSQTCQ